MTREQYLKNLKAPNGTVDVILDTDAFNEIDDQFAIAYLLASGEKLNTVGICAAPFYNSLSTSPEDGMNKSFNEIHKLLEFMGREELKERTFRGSTVYLPDESTPVPEDLYITVQNNADGKVLLNDLIGNRTALEWLLQYNPSHDGSEYNALYTKIAKSVIRQFLTQENAMKSTEIMSMLIANCETNMTLDDASAHIDTIFSYNTFKRHELNYPTNWEQAVIRLRELDGTLN
jgi:hypothetical protein